MSSNMVEVVEILDIKPHPNADRLDLAFVKGWQVIVGKGEYRKSDKVIYIPIDSVLPDYLLKILFPEGSKVVPSKGRIKTIKLRGAISQGMIVSFDALGMEELPLGMNVAEALGITKYEPPQAPVQMRGAAVSVKQVNPHFHKYTDIENFKNHTGLFEKGEIVVCTEKIHGTNFRAGWVKTVPNTWWKKVKKFFGKLPEWEFVYGSRNVQLHDKPNAKTFYTENVYKKTVEAYRLKERLDPGEVLYGEVYGDGIQKGYTYGCGPGETKLVVFDVQVGEAYLSSAELGDWLLNACLPSVPILFVGEYDETGVKELAKGPSILHPATSVREGIVIRPIHETKTHMGRKLLKLINDDYLMKDQTDFH